METLKLEHLVTAIQYRQKLQYFDDERGLNQICEIVVLRYEEMTISNNEYQYDVELNDVKPILRHLSSLIDNILDDNNDANYRLNCELADLLNTNDCSHFVKSLIENKYYAVDVRLLNDIENWLNENHFDWKYNLIDKNLAIAVTEEFNPYK